MDTKYRCENCEFWDKLSGCKRYPEVRTKVATDWCGEHSEYRKDLFQSFYGSLWGKLLKEDKHGQE